LTRLTLLALLLLALPPGASLAAGLQAEAVSCCCSDGAASPDVATRFDAPSCCKVTDGASLPTTAPATVDPTPSDPSVTLIENTVVSIVAATPSPANSVVSDLGQRPPPSLFTLHAAFLI
jgi:hypothetical protein